MPSLIFWMCFTSLAIESTLPSFESFGRTSLMTTARALSMKAAKAEILACCCCYLVKTISILRVDSCIKLCHRCYFGTLVRADHYNLDAVSRCLRRPHYGRLELDRQS